MNNGLLLSVSPLVSTEHGVGWWDGVRRELRLVFGVHVSPVPQQMRPATEMEVRLFYSIRHQTKKNLLAYYAKRTLTGD